MPSLLDLENEYADMNRKHVGNVQTTPRLLQSDPDTSTCFAITAEGGWSLCPHTWQRFVRWLNNFSNCSVQYNLHPSGHDGLMHWTLQQCQPFDSSTDTVDDIVYKTLPLEPVLLPLAGIQIIYRGIVLTPTGIALCGYPLNEEQYQRILTARAGLPRIFRVVNLPYAEPYKNTICHATVLRWTSQPSPEQLRTLYDGLHHWKEAVFGSLRPYNWIVGHLTLRVREHEIRVYKRIHTPLRIAHRGLRNGPNADIENTIPLLEKNIRSCITSEVDVWYRDNKYWLGHDAPACEITLDWLVTHRDYLLIHAKDLVTFHTLTRYKDEHGILLHIFYHTDEDVVLTTQDICIVYPGKEVLKGWMSMMPERANHVSTLRSVAICSDYSSKC